MPWDNAFYIGPTLDSSFKKLADFLGNAYADDPDYSFEPYSSYADTADLGRLGRGFPTATWRLAAAEDMDIEAYRSLFNDLLSAPFYIRMPINQRDIYGAMIWGTFLVVGLWTPAGEDKQAGKTLGFQINYRKMILQAEIP